MPGEILKQQLAFSTWHSAIRRLSVAERSKGQVLNAWRQVQISCRVFICEHNLRGHEHSHPHRSGVRPRFQISCLILVNCLTFPES